MNFITKQRLHSSRDIKEEARAQLRGHWKGAVLVSLIPTLFTIFFMSGTYNGMNELSDQFGLMDLALRIVQGFLVTGVSFTMMDFIRNREPIQPLLGVAQAFQGRYFVNLLLLKILKNVYIFLWMLLFIIPGVVKSYSYSQAERIFKDKVDQEGIVPSPRECLKESQALMDGYKLDMFTLGLSFIGWIIASLFTLGIGLIWLSPYMEVSQAVFYQNLLEQHGPVHTKTVRPVEEVGQDPNDFSDFEDF